MGVPLLHRNGESVLGFLGEEVSKHEASMRTTKKLPRLSCYLPGGGVEAIPEVGSGDDEDQGSEFLLIVVPDCLIPDWWDTHRERVYAKNNTFVTRLTTALVRLAVW